MSALPHWFAVRILIMYLVIAGLRCDKINLLLTILFVYKTLNLHPTLVLLKYYK